MWPHSVKTLFFSGFFNFLYSRLAIFFVKVINSSWENSLSLRKLAELYIKRQIFCESFVFFVQTTYRKLSFFFKLGHFLVKISVTPIKTLTSIDKIYHPAFWDTRFCRKSLIDNGFRRMLNWVKFWRKWQKHLDWWERFLVFCEKLSVENLFRQIFSFIFSFSP